MSKRKGKGKKFTLLTEARLSNLVSKESNKSVNTSLDSSNTENGNVRIDKKSRGASKREGTAKCNMISLETSSDLSVNLDDTKSNESINKLDHQIIKNNSNDSNKDVTTKIRDLSVSTGDSSQIQKPQFEDNTSVAVLNKISTKQSQERNNWKSCDDTKHDFKENRASIAASRKNNRSMTDFGDRHFNNQNKPKPNHDEPNLKEVSNISEDSLEKENPQEESWDSIHPQEESWDSIRESENSNTESYFTPNNSTSAGEWDSDFSEQNVEKSLSYSAKLNADAQEYVPPFKTPSNRPGNRKESFKGRTDDGYFDNTYQRNSKRDITSTKGNDKNWATADRRSLPTISSHQNMPQRFSEGTRKEDRGGSRDWRNSSSYDRGSESTDKEYKLFCIEENKEKERTFIRVKEIQADLFMMPKEYSLGHCVAEDMRMGSGIAVSFKREFKDLGVLLSQRQKQGGLAVLESENDGCTRYIYYLVTKRESTRKPTYEKFWSSVKKMRDHIKENDVKKLAIPRLGCGLDRLEWDRVKHMIEFLFRDVEVEITVCNFQQTEESSEKLKDRTCKVVNVLKSIADIEEETTIIYLSSEDDYESPEMEKLAKKFSFLPEFKRAKKQLGTVVKYQVPKKYYILYGCIVKKTHKDPFDFASFSKCLSQINRNNKKDEYVYVGIQAVRDDRDDLLMEKIVTLLKNVLTNVHVYVCWDGDLASRMPPSYRDNDYNA